MSSYKSWVFEAGQNILLQKSKKWLKQKKSAYLVLTGMGPPVYICLHFWEVFSLDTEFWVKRFFFFQPGKQASQCSSCHCFWWDVSSHVNLLFPYVKHTMSIWLLSTLLSFYFDYIFLKILFFYFFIIVQVQSPPFSPHHSLDPSHPHIPPLILPPFGFVPVVIYLFLRFYLFIFRQRGREGETKGEKHQCVVASCTLTRDLAQQPRHVLWLGIEPATLWFTAQSVLSPLRPTSQSIIIYFFILKSTKNYYESRCMVCVFWGIFIVCGMLSLNHYIYVFLPNLGNFCPLFISIFFHYLVSSIFLEFQLHLYYIFW